MSDRDAWTVVVPATASGSYNARGWMDRDTAIREAERHAKAELTRWQDMLRDLKAGQVRVYRQTGLYKVKNRTELMP